MARHITQKDIAKKLGVSRVTVSKALSEDADISTEMKRKVRAAAAEAGYIIHHGARSLQMRRTNTIGVVIPDISNSFFSRAIRGIIDKATARGYHVILTVSDENAETERENIHTLLSYRVDGLLVALSKDPDDWTIFDQARKMDVPLVFFDRVPDSSEFSTVAVDNRKAAQKLVEFVISSGYDKIGHLAGSQTLAIGRNRMAGYLAALKKHGIPRRNDWIISGGFDRSSGYEGFLRLLQARDRPDVIFAANDRIAQGAYKAIKEVKLAIPDDIGVVAFGHSEFAELLQPRLTIIDCPPVALGQQAVEILFSEIANPATKRRHRSLLKTTLEVGESLLVRKGQFAEAEVMRLSSNE